MSNKTKLPVYIIFGAAGGIGSELSRMLSEKLCHQVLVGRTQSALEEIAEATEGKIIVADVTKSADVKQVFQETMEKYKQIDGVVNCVGSILLKAIHMTSDVEWDETLGLNLYSSFFITREAVKCMQKNGGSIVLCSTAAAKIGIPNHEAIAAAKAGVIGLARSTAATYARKNIRVNCVSPGLTDTPLAKRITGNVASLQASKSMHALGRIGKPTDVASMIHFLLQPENNWISGQVIGVDGGLSTLISRA